MSILPPCPDHLRKIPGYMAHQAYLLAEFGQARHDPDGATPKRMALRDADLRDADLRGANLRDVDLSGANLSCESLCGSIIDGAIIGDGLGGPGSILYMLTPEEAAGIKAGREQPEVAS